MMAEEIRVGHKRRRKGDSPKPSLPQTEQITAKQKIIKRNGKKRERASSKRSPRGQNKLAKGQAWKLSDLIGGHFIHHDAVFSENEEYLILAKSSTIEVYSTSTSLLVHSIVIGSLNSDGSEITGYALSRHQPHTLWVSTFEGVISRVDWTRGAKIGQWKTGFLIHGISAAFGSASNAEDIVYTQEQTPTTWRISAHQLFGGEHASETVSKTVYESARTINQLITVSSGRAIVAALGSRVIIGTSRGNQLVPLNRLQYVWREFSTQDFITSLDIRQSVTEEALMTPHSKKSKRHDELDAPIHVVVGDTKGAVHLYEDILNEIIRLEEDQGSLNSILLTPRKMHWHREAVSSVRWSHDGNYVISGGAETVLVLWQLDTGRHQYLPHLSASIQNIVVSPTGSSYAVSLADNSTIVLSTAELSASANVAGIQARSQPLRPPPENPTRSLNSEALIQDADITDITKVPCALNPSEPSQLILAVASSQPTNLSPISNFGVPHLQTFDLIHSRHIARQALTRTNATNVNIGPEANKIVEPSVKMIAISHDGLWLATVDRWTPSSQDLEFMSLDPKGLAHEQELRTEIFLNFWAWKTESQEWELVTRINAPHQADREDSKPAQVLCLKANPIIAEFATIGEDGSVRCWRPKTRLRNKMKVYGKNAEDLVSWNCQMVISLSNQDRAATNALSERGKGPSPNAACLAFSPDGSVVAVSQQVSSADELATVHLVDAFTGTLRYSRTGLCKEGPIAMEFIRKYLVVISEYITVWNVVDNAIVFGFSLQLNKSSPSQNERLATTHLAVNQADNTFSVSLPVINKGNRSSLTQRTIRKAQSQVVVFDPTNPRPLYTLMYRNLVTALLPHTRSKGYVILDIAAGVRILSPKNSIDTSLAYMKKSDGHEPIALSGTVEASSVVSMVRGLSGSEDDGTLNTDHSKILPKMYDDDDDDDDDAAPVIRQEQLVEIFELGPSYAMPPVADLFEQVARLCSRRPVPP